MELWGEDSTQLEQKTFQCNDQPPPEELNTYSFDMESFDVTLPQEMNLKKFDFHDDESCFKNISKLQTEFSKSNDLKSDDNPTRLMNKFQGFYEEMKTRLKLLKNTPVIKSRTPSKLRQDSDSSIEATTSFKDLKKTPEVEEKLRSIKDLDDDIRNIINDYKTQREQRLQTQFQLCSDICKNVLPERNTQSFLDMCHFEFSEVQEDEENDDALEHRTDYDVPETFKTTPNGNTGTYAIIKRNIEVAKTGVLAGSSLTDEEKSRIELLLGTDVLNPNEESSENFTESYPTNLDSISGCNNSNAYSFLDGDRVKLSDIDEKLEKFADDEKDSEKNREHIENVSGLKEDFVLKQALQRINEQIKELRNRDLKDADGKDILDLEDDNGTVEDVEALEFEDKMSNEDECFNYNNEIDSSS